MPIIFTTLFFELCPDTISISFFLTLSSFDNQSIINKIKNADLTKLAYLEIVAIAVYRDYGGYKYVKLVIADAENIWFEE